LIAIVAGRGDIDRATALGADLCVRAGTTVHARALVSWTKEAKCPRSRPTSSLTPMTSGVPA
jgi:hypothetical protein